MLRIFNTINMIFVAVTIIFHLLNYTVKEYEGFGISSQFFLGVYQLLFALSLLGSTKKFNESSTRLMKYYWLLIVVFILTLFLLQFNAGKLSIAIVFIVVPMLIACYQTDAFDKIIKNINDTPS